MANDPADPQGPASYDREQLRRLYRIITGAEPLCPACGEPLGPLVAEREACARQDAFVCALGFVRAAMTNQWSLTVLVEILQACADATTV